MLQRRVATRRIDRLIAGVLAVDQSQREQANARGAS
jgi:hypothetical protein